MYAQGYSRGYSAAPDCSRRIHCHNRPPEYSFDHFSGAITNTSVPALFAAGALPGFLAGLSLLIPAIWIARKKGYGSEQEGVEEGTDWPLAILRERPSGGCYHPE